MLEWRSLKERGPSWLPREMEWRCDCVLIARDNTSFSFWECGDKASLSGLLETAATEI